VDYEKVAGQRRDYPQRFNMTSINDHEAKGGGIWFFGVEGYDDASMAKLKEISPLTAIHRGMPNHARQGGIHSNCGLVLRRAAAGISLPSPLSVTAGASFGHDHQVFELQEVFELSSFFGTQSIGFGQFDQVRDARQRFFRGTERVYLLG